MLAYIIKDLQQEQCRESPITARLRKQLTNSVNGSWSYLANPEGGTIAVWGANPTIEFNREAYGASRQTPEGWTYLPPLVMPSLIDCMKGELSRPNDGEFVTLSCGEDLFVAVASLTERRWILSASGSTRRAPTKSAYGIYSRQLYEMVTGKNGSAEEQAELEIKLIIEAIHASYDISDEMIEDHESLHLSSVDIGMIRGIAWGLSPKESAAVLQASLLPLPAAE